MAACADATPSRHFSNSMVPETSPSEKAIVFEVPSVQFWMPNDVPIANSPVDVVLLLVEVPKLPM